jgi:triosephosphate isomerase
MPQNMQRTTHVIANWKMHGNRQWIADYASDLSEKFDAYHGPGGFQLGISPPHVFLKHTADQFDGLPVNIGGQNCHFNQKGAHTGDVSANMLADCGAGQVILGHSERRADHGESGDLIRRKIIAAHDSGLTVILCVGEKLADRKAGKQNSVVLDQLAAAWGDTITDDNMIVAYEPVWAIGTGETAGATEIGQMHAAIREWLEKRLAGGGNIPLLYGGSVKPHNAKEIFDIQHVDGGLIGSASLSPDDFWAIGLAGENKPA